LQLRRQLLADPVQPGSQRRPAEFAARLRAAGPGCLRRGLRQQRGNLDGNVVFQDYCASNNYASGGFVADSKISGDLDFYGNQQYMVRNSSIGGANGCPQGLWNMVYSGVQGAPATVFTGQCEQNTDLSTSPVTEEEPFLFTDSGGNYNVFVPAVQQNSSGPSWASGTEAGSSIPLSKFFVANPATPTPASTT
jgi:hypothetical protein